MKIRKVISFILVACLVMTFNLSALAADGKTITNNSSMLISSLSEDQCLSFIKSKGITVPSDLKNSPTLGKFVKSIIKQTEESPNSTLPINYTVARDFANKIKAAVNKFHNNVNYSASVNAYTLQDSTVIGSWSDSYENYNCYGYAINRTSNYVNPGYYSNQSFGMGLNIQSMADLVVDDLDKLGYWGYTTTTRPTSSSLASFEKAICIRKGSEDYHFMKYNGSWNHKPGGTNPLKYNYSSPAYKTWSNECSYRGVTYAPGVWYNSSVIYIIYWVKGVGPQPYVKH